MKAVFVQELDSCDDCVFYEYFRCHGSDCTHPDAPEIGKRGKIEPRAENRKGSFPGWCPYIVEKLKDNFEIQSIKRVSSEKVEVSFCEGGKYTRFSNGSWCDSGGYLDDKPLENELEKSYRKFCRIC